MLNNDDPAVSNLPLELFREILALIPPENVVSVFPKLSAKAMIAYICSGLRLVCKLWKARIDTDHWRFRVIYSKSKPTLDTLESHLLVNSKSLLQHLQYIDIESQHLGLSFLKLLPRLGRLKTVILRSTNVSFEVFESFCVILPTISIHMLELHDLSWIELSRLCPVLTYCNSIRILSLNMSEPTREEQDACGEEVDWDHIIFEDIENQLPEADPVYSLQSLSVLTINFVSIDTWWNWEGGVESTMYAMLHKPLIKIILASTNLMELTIANKPKSPDELPDGDRMVAYKQILRSLRPTHPKLKQVSLEHLIVDSWNFPWFERLNLIECPPTGVDEDGVSFTPNSNIQTFRVSWSQWMTSRFRNAPFSDRMIEYRAYDISGGSMVAFLDFLRCSQAIIATMQVVEINVAENAKIHPDELLNDADISLIVRRFPNLRSFKFIAKLRCSDNATDVLRSGLPMLQHLKVEESSLHWSL